MVKMKKKSEGETEIHTQRERQSGKTEMKWNARLPNKKIVFAAILIEGEFPRRTCVYVSVCVRACLYACMWCQENGIFTRGKLFRVLFLCVRAWACVFLLFVHRAKFETKLCYMVFTNGFESENKSGKKECNSRTHFAAVRSKPLPNECASIHRSSYIIRSLFYIPDRFFFALLHHHHHRRLRVCCPFFLCSCRCCFVVGFVLKA